VHCRRRRPWLRPDQDETDEIDLAARPLLGEQAAPVAVGRGGADGEALGDLADAMTPDAS
jgi:hypothetical protein